MELKVIHDEKGHVCQGHGPGELIHVDCACHVYQDGTVGIHNMCFSVHEREIVALCGPNGSGKSTLIEHLNGLLLPSSGSVEVMGRKLDLKSGVWREVGVVFQRSDDQLFAPTVLDDVMFGPLNMGMSIDDARKAALEALRILGAEGLVDKMPNYLSGGQKRLVCIAGVLAMKPRIIAMDEPTSDLDPLHTDAIEHIILDLKKTHGISVVIATHDLDLAARVADRVCVVKDGSIIAEGSASEIFYDDALLALAGLKQPRVIGLYRSIMDKSGAVPAGRPVRMEELAEFVAGLIKKSG
jgi:cobalt/nickel transport system ATP-binding protein